MFGTSDDDFLEAAALGAQTANVLTGRPQDGPDDARPARIVVAAGAFLRTQQKTSAWISRTLAVETGPTFNTT